MDWFLYANGLHHERIKLANPNINSEEFKSIDLGLIVTLYAISVFSFIYWFAYF